MLAVVYTTTDDSGWDNPGYFAGDADSTVESLQVLGDGFLAVIREMSPELFEALDETRVVSVSSKIVEYADLYNLPAEPDQYKILASSKVH